MRVTAHYGKVGPKSAEYYMGKERVGIRDFFDRLQIQSDRR